LCHRAVTYGTFRHVVKEALPHVVRDRAEVATGTFKTNRSLYTGPLKPLIGGIIMQVCSKVVDDPVIDGTFAGIIVCTIFGRTVTGTKQWNHMNLRIGWIAEESTKEDVKVLLGTLQ
jgi:hypothetical protein